MREVESRFSGVQLEQLIDGMTDRTLDPYAAAEIVVGADVARGARA